MSDKFDQILTEITQLKAENVQLKWEVNELNDKVSISLKKNRKISTRTVEEIALNFTGYHRI